jgi:hypothetical protein
MRKCILISKTNEMDGNDNGLRSQLHSVTLQTTVDLTKARERSTINVTELRPLMIALLSGAILPVRRDLLIKTILQGIYIVTLTNMII